MSKAENPIGFFDSGVGGISVLKEAVKQMPNENYIYFGDSKNAPYGIKSLEQVKEFTIDAAEMLINKGIKALVIACNTATSAAVDELRKKYDSIPIIGVEPALKPAVELHRRGKIIIMATPMTLSEKKFKDLMLNYENEADILCFPCPGLVEFIEKGILEGEELEQYFIYRFSDINKNEIAAIVLGCTHYPFVKEEIRKFIGNEIPIIDGSFGTVKHLKKQLESLDLLNRSLVPGNVEILNSSGNENIISLSYRLLYNKQRA